MTDTKIQWTDTTWNPVVGCSRVSAGCAHCYAERVDHRLRGAAHQEWKAWTAPNAAYNVRLHPERLEAPLHWRKPRRVFVNSMSDLFHELVPDEFIDKVFAVMALAPQHVFQILTKRPERMRAYLSHSLRENAVIDAAQETEGPTMKDATGATAITFDWPLPNVWLGVSAEDQATADARIPELLATPTAVRFVSYEPALGPVFLKPWFYERWCWQEGQLQDGWGDRPSNGSMDFPHIQWVIVGGESGSGARPFDIQWARDTIAQCRAAGVPVFVKQCGACPVDSAGDSIANRFQLGIKDSHGGDMEEWPEDLRVRQFPGGAL